MGRTVNSRQLVTCPDCICPKNCDICDKQPENERLYFDHSHATGQFRGWLCRHCNSALGLVSDSPEILRKMIEYLEAQT